MTPGLVFFMVPFFLSWRLQNERPGHVANKPTNQGTNTQTNKQTNTPAKKETNQPSHKTRAGREAGGAGGGGGIAVAVPVCVRARAGCGRRCAVGLHGGGGIRSWGEGGARGRNPLPIPVCSSSWRAECPTPTQESRLSQEQRSIAVSLGPQ